MLEELIEKLIKLDRNLNKTESILTQYDKELNRYHKLIKRIKHYCLKTNMTIEEYENLIKLIEE